MLHLKLPKYSSFFRFTERQQKQETHLSVFITVALCVQSKELLSQLHLQVTFHRAVVITWAARLQGGGRRREGMMDGGEEQPRGRTRGAQRKSERTEWKEKETQRQGARSEF